METVRVILASGNPGKRREFQDLVGSAFQLDPLPDGVSLPEETGQTYRENARLKAEAVARATSQPALADDSGLEVQALDGAPGVRSARFAGEEATDAENVRKLLRRMEHVPDPRRQAAFVAVLCLVRPGRPTLFTEGRVYGHITWAPRGRSGFGYDPVFLDRSGRTFAEMTAREKNSLSHRAQAVTALLRALAEEEASSFDDRHERT